MADIANVSLRVRLDAESGSALESDLKLFMVAFRTRHPGAKIEFERVETFKSYANGVFQEHTVRDRPMPEPADTPRERTRPRRNGLYGKPLLPENHNDSPVPGPRRPLDPKR